MCARIDQRIDYQAVLAGLDLTGPAFQPAAAAHDRNEWPGERHVILRRAHRDAQPAFAELTWGLVPQWRRDDQFRAVNARGETLAAKPSFRDAFRRRRALVPVNGWYEWTESRNGGSRRVPVYIRDAASTPVLLAALWEPARRGGRFQETFCIITTAPRKELAHIHDRQPAVLNTSEALAWLDPDTPGPTLRRLATEPGNARLTVCTDNSEQNQSPRSLGLPGS